MQLSADHLKDEKYRNFYGSDELVDIAEAYAVQDRFVSIRKDLEKDVIAGYKIGLTSDRMQGLLGINSPIAGVVLKNGVTGSGGWVDKNTHGRVGLECEVVVIIGRDLPPNPDRPYTFNDVQSAISGICPGFEIIDDRNADYQSVDVLSLIADNSWNAGLIIGENVAAWPDLAKIEGTLQRDGEFLDAGKGVDVLGHPFKAVHWLADVLRIRGLRKGDYVATGSIIPTVFPEVGESYRFTVSGIGSVDVKIR